MSTPLKLQKIVVKGLFDLFDHEIPLNQNEGVTVMLGPNGFGKTAILRMVNEIFGADRVEDCQAIFRTVFQELTLYFTEGRRLRLEVAERIDEKHNRIRWWYRQSSLEEEQIVALLLDNSSAPKSFGPPKIVQGYAFMYSNPLKFGMSQLPPSIHLPEADWMEELRYAIDIHFIETERLRRRINRDFERKEELSVTVLARELSNLIENIQAENAEIASALERSFPKRLMQRQRSQEPTLAPEEIAKKLAELEAERARLIRLGILPEQGDADLPTSPIDENSRVVLSIYIEDTEKKLGVFKDLADRLELFHRIMDTRFLFKTMTTDKAHGYRFTTAKGKELPADGLSSGEQHELILFYQLLFQTAPGSLVLLDEPEISLHVSWQVGFLQDLLDVTKLAGFSVLLATHSPQIVNERWDLTVSLQAPQQ